MKTKIILGFTSVTMCMVFISVIGWYSAIKIDRIENKIITGYKIKNAILEFRRQEKNLLLRGPAVEYLALWNISFNELKNIHKAAKEKKYINFNESKILTNDINKYKELFDSFVYELKTKGVFNNEEIATYDDTFKNSGRIVLALSDKILKEAEEEERATDKSIYFILLSFCVAGIFFSIVLGGIIVKITSNSLRKIENLRSELENNYLELALGLSEHFEVLKRVAKGELNIKSPESSSNELISKLGSVINQTIARLNENAKKEFEQAFILSASGIRIVDKDFNVVKTNQTLAELSGVGTNEMTGKKCYEYFRGSHCHTDRCTLKLILAGAEKVEKEQERERADGSKAFCLLKTIPLKDPGGNVIGIIQDFSDIAKLKQIEEELAKQSIILAVALSEVFEALKRVAAGDLSVKLKEESENDLLSKLNNVVNRTIANLKKSWDDLASAKLYSENIIESIRDMIFVADTDTVIQTVNSVTSDVLGYSREECIGKALQDFFTENDKPFEFSGMIKLIGENVLNNYEIYCKSKSGMKIPVLFNYSTIKNKDGGIEYMVCTAKDITERKRMEETLRDSEERYRNLVETSPDVIALLDLDLNVLMINQSGVDLYGYDRVQDVVGKSASDFIISEELPYAIESRNKVLEAGEIRNIELISKRKDGSTFFIELNATLIKDKDKTPEAILIIFRDITARKQAEKELKKAYDTLKELQSQLVQTEKMAAIGQLAGGVAHEINNPLTGVLNNVQLVKMISEEKKDFTMSEFKEILDVIEESALRCKKITESLLDFSHTSMGDFRSLSLNAIIEKIGDLIDNEIKLQNIVIKNELHPDLPHVKGDAQLLQQIIVNLISNAKWAIEKKFDKSGGRIDIKTEYVLNSAFVNLYISDNGTGIPEDKLGKIFEPFFTTKQVGEGTGLGLSIVYNIIRRHKGTIAVESRVNEGTTFKITLPVAV